MMSRKKLQRLTMEPIRVASSVEATLQAKPRFNGFVCGYGAHGCTKYNRARENRKWKQAIACQ